MVTSEDRRDGPSDLNASVGFGTQPPSHELASMSPHRTLLANSGSTRLMPALLPQTKTYSFLCTTYIQRSLRPSSFSTYFAHTMRILHVL